jgi:hypothetical protein
LDWLETWKRLEDSEIESMSEERIRRRLSTARRFLAIDISNVLWSVLLILFRFAENAQSSVYVLVLQHASYFLLPSIIVIVFFNSFHHSLAEVP